ncbi:hypothetical protein [Salipaludibacillus aurantiacus]|uniref:hypothetical protein n=1 Tax=Salipaludibacillus aurantiacus TaxID=1601833 RepID=UPI0015A6BDD5|nr:hypothetical protein [Salipaludibacillus aurantiacus]
MYQEENRRMREYKEEKNAGSEVGATRVAPTHVSGRKKEDEGVKRRKKRRK